MDHLFGCVIRGFRTALVTATSQKRRKRFFLCRLTGRRIDRPGDHPAGGAGGPNAKTPEANLGGVWMAALSGRPGVGPAGPAAAVPPKAGDRIPVR
jgi:hypothetical protein